MSKWKFVAMPRYQMRRNAINKLLNLCGNLQGKKLLEIGYGAGDIFSLYDKLGINIYGYDYSDETYQYVRNNVRIENMTLLLKEDLIKENGPYDFVVASEVMEHIKDDTLALKKWVSYLKPGGVLIISVPAHMKRWGYSDVAVGHYKRYEKKELVCLCQKSGIKCIKIWTYDFPACLFLDGMRDSNRKRKFASEKNDGSDKETLTKESGLRRDFSKVEITLASPYIWWPIIKFEELFYYSDLGSAYILMAKKAI